jgi:hypothetical protein
MPVATATPSPTNAPKQLSDQNSLGTQLGVSATDIIGFYGATPVAQPAGSFQDAATRGNAAGGITTYSTSQSPTAVTLNTSVESNFTVQTGTGATMIPATGDVFVVNKLAAQAGLGMGNVRFGSSGVIAVNFSNVTGSTITPTGSEVYKVVGLRGAGTVTAVLSPAAVPATSTSAQQFAVEGAIAGSLVIGSKPTSQTGLDIGNFRVVSDDLVEIEFINATASPITPTASETYSFVFLSGADALNNFLVYAYNAGTIGAMGSGVTVSGVAPTVTGIATTDFPVGPPAKPTAQAAATNNAVPTYSVFTANTITPYWFGVGTGITPTAAEVYDQLIYRPAPAAPLVLYSQSIAPTSVAANTSAEQTFTVTGLVASSLVAANKPSYTSGIAIGGVRVSALNQIAITFINVTAAAIVPPTETWLIGNFQVLAPGAGNSVTQGFAPNANQAGNLANAMRSAMTSLGLIAGA